MQQLISVWFGIDGRKRVTLILAVLAMFATVYGLSRVATAPTMALLYSGLEPGSAGEVVKALEQQGVNFEIRNNAIFVDSSQRDRLRMSLAADGLPANNGKGYELLDSLSGFGTTSQMFDVAYWRAKEGELARTIAASPQFSQARVHISNTVSTPFRRGISPTASVTVTATSGSLSAGNAKALKYLVSSAVAGMSPSDVAIIDGRNGVVIQDDGMANGASGEADRADLLRSNVKRLLEARVGPGNVVVEVNVETLNESEKLFERTLDPGTRVAVSSRKEETSRSSNNSGSGAVTVASNLPAGNAQPGGNDSSSQTSETRETTNYEMSETTRELTRAPGRIRRVSVAVLVNDVLQTDPSTNAQTWTPRSDAELSDLRDLVASAVGFDAQRGDTITLKSLRFEAPPTTGTLAQSSTFSMLDLDVMRLVQLGVLGVVTLVLGLFVIRPILTQTPPPALPAARTPDGLPNLAPAQELRADGTGALTGEIDERDTSQNLPVVSNDALPTSSAPAPAADPVDRLREMISERHGETVEILKSWMDSEEERA